MKTKNLERNKELAPLTTFGIGGPAQFFVEARTVEDFKAAFDFAKENKLPFLILGKGSNILFDDRGFQGLVILNKLSFLEKPTPTSVRVGSGYSYALLGVQTARLGLSGLEFASGIPASVGGAIAMNAGASGQETADMLTSVEFLREDGELLTFLKKDLSFSYRTSPFQEMKGAILAATFTLAQSPEARQKQIEIVRYRTKTQPYGDKSAGCIFRNPTPYSAGQLIDQCGLKGLERGGAAVSPLHANFVVNKENATQSDILALVGEIQKRVKEEKGIELAMEVKVIPYDPLQS